MDNNVETVRKLFSKGYINCKEDEIIFRKPKNYDLPKFDKIEGMLLGLAIGDSLGNTSESGSVGRRNKRYGIIKSYLPNKHLGMKRKGFPSDDTQLAFDTVEVFLKNDYLNVKELADVFCSHHIYGIGKTVMAFIKNYKDKKIPWYKAGVKMSSNGALMRIAPVVVPHINHPMGLYSDAVLDTMLTHNDSLAIASSVAYVDMLWDFIHKQSGEIDKEEQLKKFSKIVSSITGGETCTTRREVDDGLFNNDIYSGDAGIFIEKCVNLGLKEKWKTIEFHRKIGSGAFLMETVPTALFIILNNIDEPRQAIIESVNYTRDNDTIAAIVGAAVGALHGKKFLDNDWIENLSGCVKGNDEGAVQRMIKEVSNRLEN
jgi:ADP-ribosylglycohydrolase